MTQELKNKLCSLADKYETVDFIKNDPSKFMHQIKDERNQEIVAFLAANLAFGKREQILKHIQMILDKSGDDITGWILNGKYENFFPHNDKSFYRTYSNNAMISFFNTIRKIFTENEQFSTSAKKISTFGNYVEIMWNKNPSSDNGQKSNETIKANEIKIPKMRLHSIISSIFPKECTLLPHTENSAAKKVNMFLRWMVRTNSPVDLGIWTWFDKKNLLLPLDTHVMQEATKLGLLETNKNGNVKSADLKTAIELTKTMSQVFPDDPCRGDFALFGLGVNS